MTAINWKGNNHSGAFVVRQLKALEPVIEKAKGTRKLVLLSHYTMIWERKAKIAKPERNDEELEALRKELDELKTLAGLAQKNQGSA